MCLLYTKLTNMYKLLGSEAKSWHQPRALTTYLTTISSYHNIMILDM